MLCSVVIPVHDGARFLDATLASVRAQDYRPIEVIVVDDGSTDETPAVLTRWPDAIVVRQERGGTAAARNAGVARARGDFIALDDADDLWVPHKLRVQIGHLVAHPELGYVVAHYRNFLEPGTPRPAWLGEQQLLEPQPGAIGNLVIRAEALRRIGPFDPADWSDFDWSLRARDAGIAAAVLPEVLLHRRVHDRNASHERHARADVRLRALRASIARRRSTP
jgi:glycosyltransferase involved in cell wall biosynthesis